MDHNEVVFYEQYEAQMRAQDEEKAAAASAATASADAANT
ncbi:hypothetical protein A2U01_0079491, partial [Trifolium medium]|nr:hypothetical protein [Trifolium medium]